jgi:aryl-alcohol dehydrogenase-like predicted oxidoreductase
VKKVSVQVGLARRVSLIDLLEREVIRYCKKTGVGLIPWSPLAAGGLCRPASQQLGTTTRAEQNVDKLKRQSTAQADVEIINRVEEIAKKKGWTMAQVAFAWVKQGTTAPILGVSTEARLQEFVAAIDFRLTPDEKFYLEEPYETKSVHGFDQDRTTS